MTWKAWTKGLVVLWIMAFAACGGGGDGGAGEDAGGDAGAAAPDDAAAPAVDPATAATIRGAVTFEGVPPAMTEIDMREEPVCSEKYPTDPPMTENVVSSDGRLANTFVYVKEGLAGEWPAPAEAASLDQVGCRYDPHIVGLQAGQTLLIRNGDAVLHNINTQPTANRGFNISQPQAGMESRREFSRAEVMIPVKCDVHGWMSAFLGVVDHPYHAVSLTDGTFELASLPPGTYTIEAWHEVYGTMSQEVTVGDAETAEVTFAYSADMASAVVPMADPLVLTHGPYEGREAAHGGGNAGAGR
ncbi:MAG: hypothetical protein KAJ43_06990 [Gemmatimonadetes bacterium]|nr:hypothetical protein [Gemmatimonadota bacterium]